MDRISFKRNINYFWILKYVTYFFIFMFLSRATLTKGVIPFAFGFYLGLCYLKQNILLLSLFYIVTAFIVEISFISLFVAILHSVIIIIFFMIAFKLNFNFKSYVLGIVGFCAGICSCFFYLNNVSDIIKVLITSVVSIVFMFVVINAFCVMFLRGVEVKRSIDEKICLLSVLFAIFLGASGIKIYFFDLFHFISVLFILIFIMVSDIGGALCLSIICGVSALIYNNSPAFLIVLSISTMIASTIKGLSKYFVPIPFFIVDIVFGMYFKLIPNFEYLRMINIAIAVFVFLLIPKSFFEFVLSKSSKNNQDELFRELVNRSREQMAVKLNEIADVFSEMQRVFMNMVKSTMTVDEAVIVLGGECKEKICGDCPEYSKCHITHKIQTDESFGSLIKSSIERGKATILDLPNYLSARCKRVSALLSMTNQSVNSFRQYSTLNGNLNNSRTLIGGQMGGVSKIIRELANECKEKIRFNLKAENAVALKLASYGIACNQAIIYENEGNVSNVNVVLSGEVDESELIEAVSKIFNCKMMIVAKEQSDNKRMNYYIKNAPSFDVIFGASGCKKFGSEVSGDTHSLIKISEDKFILALCDGMGSGDKAHKISETTMNLVENFYKAGFSDEVILDSVNKLLGISGDEVFTAIDICVMDLQKAFAVFLKLGGVSSFLKMQNEVIVLQGSALPMGVLEEIQPSVSKQILREGDFLIMVTDGVTDAFYDDVNLRQFINDIDEINPQSIADKIIMQAIKNNNDKPKDDMTVLVGRVICCN